MGVHGIVCDCSDGSSLYYFIWYNAHLQVVCYMTYMLQDLPMGILGLVYIKENSASLDLVVLFR